MDIEMNKIELNKIYNEDCLEGTYFYLWNMILSEPKLSM